MSFILEGKKSTAKYKTTSTKNREVKVHATLEPSNKINWEPTEIMVRLNELAKARPFNILYRVKKYDTL